MELRDIYRWTREYTWGINLKNIEWIVLNSEELHKFYDDNYGYGNISFGKGIECIEKRIPEQYREILSKYNTEEYYKNNDELKSDLEYWYLCEKRRCQDYLRDNKREPIGEYKSFKYFDSLEDFVNNVNRVRVMIGLEPKNVEEELKELRTESPRKLTGREFYEATKDMLVPIEFSIDTSRGDDESFTHDYYNGINYTTVYDRYNGRARRYD